MANILHVSKFYSPFKGGIESVVKSLALGAIENKHRVKVYCSSHDNTLPRKESLDGVEVHRGKTLGMLARQPVTPGLFLKLRTLFKWADVIYLHTPNPMAELAARLLMPQEKVLIVLHHSDIIHQKILKKLYLPFQKIVYTRANSIVVFSSHHIKYSKQLTSFEYKSEIIPFGIERSTQDISDQRCQAVRRRFGPYALFIGRLVSYKGVERIVEAAQYVDFKFLVIGDGPLRKALEQKATTIGVEEKVIFLGKIENDQEFQTYLKCCSFLVLPSVSPAENYGVVQIEAMTYKKALVVSDLKSGASSIVRHNKSGILIPPHGVKELVKAVKTLMENQSLSDSMGECGHQLFCDFYTRKAMIQSHEDLVSKLLHLNKK